MLQDAVARHVMPLRKAAKDFEAMHEAGGAYTCKFTGVTLHDDRAWSAKGRNHLTAPDTTKL